VLALIYLQAWSVLLCTHIYIRMLRGVNTAYGVKGCVSNTACVIIVTHVVTWFYADVQNGHRGPLCLQNIVQRIKEFEDKTHFSFKK